MHVTRLTTAVFGALLALSIGLVAQAQTQVLELDGGLQVPITTQTPNGLRARPGVVGPAVPAVPAEAVTEVTEEVVEGLEEDAEDRSIGASDTLLIEYRPLGEDEIDDAREALLERIFGNRIFKVDRQGVLRLPILGAIPLGGLTAPRAAQRLQSEGPLRDVEVSVTLLPLAPIGVDAVEGFGYDVFGASAAGAFQPSIDVPVPSSYVVGPGDIVELHLFGEKTMSYVLEISREGVLNIPELGPLSVTGMTFQQLKDDVKERVEKQFIGVSAYITLGTLRAFQIFIIGEVIAPGAYTVSALSTITSALIQSGGIKPTGSLRNVQLKRGDRVVARLDLYGLLLSGDKSGDHHLSANDVIFVPTIGTTVQVAGEVRRPAIYELKGGERLQTLVELAGGLNPNARLGEAQLERVAQGRERRVIDIDLSDPEQLAMLLESGDSLQVPSLEERIEAKITLSGHVRAPGIFQWRPGLTLAGVIKSNKDLLPGADTDYVLIKRRDDGNGPISARSVQLGDPSTSQIARSTALHRDDEIIVFHGTNTSDRATLLEPIIDILRAQATAGRQAQIVSIGGPTRAPGTYPLEAGMRVADLIRAAGKLEESAYLNNAELTRYSNGTGASRSAEHVNIDLQAALRGDPSANISLQAHDYLTVKPVPLWNEQQQFAEVYGEVNFPGRYPISHGEQLSSVPEGSPRINRVDGRIR